MNRRDGRTPPVPRDPAAPRIRLVTEAAEVSRPSRPPTRTGASPTSSTTCSPSRASTRSSSGSPTRSTTSSRTRRCTSTRPTSQAELVPALVRSEYAEEILQKQFPFGEGITGWAVEHREPVLANQAHLDPRVQFVPGTRRAGGADRRPARRRARSRARSTSTGSASTRASPRRSSSWRSASATPPRSRSTTRTSATGSSARRRPTRSPASTTTATSTSGCGAS